MRGFRLGMPGSRVTKTVSHLILGRKQLLWWRSLVPAGTTRGFGNTEFVEISLYLLVMLDGLAMVRR